MKQKGGLPEALKRRPLSGKMGPPSMPPPFRSILPYPQPPPPGKSGLTKLFKRPRSPFTGPGPSTAGRKKYMRRRTRKVRR